MQERKKQDALAAANKLTDALVDHLNVGVAQAFKTIHFSRFLKSKLFTIRVVVYVRP